VLAIVLGALLLLASAGAVAGERALGLDQLPPVSALAAPLPADTLVYDRTGTVLLADLHQPGYQHLDAPLRAMGRWLPLASVAVDDPGFWAEPAVDPLGLARAGWTYARGPGIVRGGSTITQRLVRQRLMAVTRPSVAGKVREAYLAAQAATTFSKTQVLELYLNGLFYGNGAYGGQTAAQVYFGIDASRLDLAQASLLAGLPAQPSLLDPLHALPAAKQRQRQVLDAMVRAHVIGGREADQAYGETLTFTGPTALIRAPELVGQVTAQLTARLHTRAWTSAGLHVVTTLDWDLQQQARQAVRDAVQASAWRGAGNGALVALDPRTSEVLAQVGSIDRTSPNGQYDMSTWPPRNPGTSFRVFTYAAAIASRRYTMVTLLTDGPTSVVTAGGPPYQPRNRDSHWHGTCELQACLGNDLVAPAVQVQLSTGLPEVVRTARAMGAPPWFPHFDPSGSIKYTNDDPVDRYGPSLTLGGYGQTPLQLATGLSVLASGGLLRQPRFIRTARTSAGAVVLGPEPAASRAIDAGTAFVVGQMLADDANRALIYGQGSPLTLPGRRAAALVGTTDDLTDAWAAGCTPSLVTAVWMGNPDYRPMQPGSDGLLVAAPAWHRFMQAALDRLQRGDEWFTPPGGVQQAQAGGRTAWFLDGTSPTTPAPPLPDSVRVGPS